MTKPTSNAMSPTSGTFDGTIPTYFCWLEKSHTDSTTPTTIAIGPAQFLYAGSYSGPGSRRRSQSARTTPSQGPIQYEMTSRNASYFAPASDSPDSATKNP